MVITKVAQNTYMLLGSEFHRLCAACINDLMPRVFVYIRRVTDVDEFWELNTLKK